jgi:hypothetical protein
MSGCGLKTLIDNLENSEIGGKDSDKEAFTEFTAVLKLLNEKRGKSPQLKITSTLDREKTLVKVKSSNKYIGYGASDSSTASYANQLESQDIPVNAGEYSSDDVVFVSINGKKGLTTENFDKTLAEVKLALDAGARVLTDSETYLKEQNKDKDIDDDYEGYNIGEAKLRVALLKEGYINGPYIHRHVSVWGKAAEPKDSNNNTEVSNVQIVPRNVKGSWTRKAAETNKGNIYVFGENSEQTSGSIEIKKGPLKGNMFPKGAQAAVRGLSNAIGLITVKNENKDDKDRFFTDGDFKWFKEHVDGILVKLDEFKQAGKNIIFPGDGIDAGEAKLKENAPRLYNYLAKKLNDFTGNESYMEVIPEENTESTKLKSDDKDKNKTKSSTDALGSDYDVNYDQDKFDEDTFGIDQIEAIIGHLHDMDVNDILPDTSNMTEEEKEEAFVKADKSLDIELLDARAAEIYKILAGPVSNEKFIEDFRLRFYQNPETDSKGNRSVVSGRAAPAKREIDLKLNGQIRFGSRVSTFMHEMQHILIEPVLQKDSKLRAQIKRAREFVIKEFKNKGYDYRVLLDGKPATDAEIEYAKRQWEYMLYNPNNPESEFLAHATNNPLLHKAIESIREPIQDTLIKELTGTEKTPIKNVLNFFIKIINKFYSNIKNEGKDTTAKKALQDVLNLALERAAQRDAYINDDQFSENTKGMLAQADDKIKKYTDKLHELVYGDETQIHKNTGLASYLSKIYDAKGIVKISDYVRTTNLISPFIRNATSKLLQAQLALFNRNKKLMERDVNIIYMGVLNKLNGTDQDENKDFTYNLRNLEDSEKIASKEVLLDTGITDSYKDINELIPLLKDDKLLQNTIDTLYKELELSKLQRVKNHADALSKKLVHRREFITNGYENTTMLHAMLSKDITKVSEMQYAAYGRKLDAYVGLKALQEISRNDKDLAIAAIQKEGVGLQVAVDLHNKHIQEAREVFFENKDVMIPKGYSKTITDDSKVFYATDEKEGKELEKIGFKKVRKQENLSKIEGKPIYIYVGADYMETYTTGMIGLVRVDLREGLYLKKWLSERTPIRHDAEVEAIIANLAKQEAKNVVDDDESIMSPKRSSNGEIVDYSIDLSKSEKFDMAGLDNNIVEVVARTVSNITKKENTIIANKDAIDFVFQFNEENETTGNTKDFILVRPTSPKEKQAGKVYKYDHLWNVLPSYSKKYIKEAYGSESIPIHKDHLLNFFGEKEASAGNLFNNKRAKKITKQSEQFISEVVGRIKKILVPLDLEAVIANLVSNALTVSMETDSINPLEYSRKFKDKWVQLEEYLTDEREMQNAILSAKLGDEKAKNRIKYLNHKMRKNPLHDLIEAGQYNQLIEDVDMGNYEDHSEFRTKVMNKINKAPEWFKNTFRELYVTNDSETYKKVIKLTQYGDIISRAMLLDYYKENTDMSHDDILAEVDAKFINYAYLDNNLLRYVNKTGIVTFTKFFARSLPVVAKLLIKKPVTLGTYTALQWATVDIPDIVDNYLQNPIDALGNRVTSDPEKYIWELMFPTFFNLFVK